MKRNCWLVIGTLFATAAVAQVNTNSLPPIPAPANLTVAPAAPAVAEPAAAPAAPVKKKAVHKKAAKPAKKLAEPATVLVPGTATVLPPNLNLRGQAGLKGEVVGHLKAGDTVTVVSDITLDKHAADEPAQWAKIALPSGTKVWVNTHFVDAASKTVSAKKLNLRAGPGENYSVLGVIEKGTAVNELAAKGDWSQIEAPTNAFAFVAAMFLKQEAAPAAAPANPAPAVVETPVPTPAPATTSNVAEAQPIVTQPAPTPAPETAPAPANAAAETPTNIAPAVVDTNPPPPRVVSHEGYVRPSVSVVAPTYYELFDWDTGKSINYLYSPTTNLDLSRYDGHKIIVTGQEGMADRWPATPVLTIQKIYVTATNYPPSDNKRVSSPHASGSRR